MTHTRSIETDLERQHLVTYLERQQLPVTVTITKGKKRSTRQNMLLHRWLSEICQQVEGWTHDEARAYCKLRLGVPILRAENEAYRTRYDEVVRPLPYETKIELMKEPFDFPVTSQMNTKQFTAYLDAISRHWSEQGVILSHPEDQGREVA